MATPAPDMAADLDFVGGPFGLFTHLSRTSLFLDALQEEFSSANCQKAEADLQEAKRARRARRAA